ncbi:MAG: NTP transferase domain-containing protein [Planctomycetota bacterium]|nr:NTP transferase domain-containing protein [Planctomycetota bacterium]
MNGSSGRVHAIILAAGFGTRMKSKLPKVLHEVAGRPLVEYPLRAAQSVCGDDGRIVVVVGSGRDQVEKALSGNSVEFAVQDPPRGSGDAARVGLEMLNPDPEDRVLILCGDAPLLRKEELHLLVKEGQDAAAVVLTAHLEDPGAYGRIQRCEDGALRSIVEAVDLSDESENTNEVNSGIYLFRAGDLKAAIGQVGCTNAKGEFYLTDCVEILIEAGKRFLAVVSQDSDVVLGVNSRSELSRIDALLRRRVVERLQDQGVTIVDPDNTRIEEGVEIGADTVIHPFTVIRRDARIGSGCSVGPFAQIHPEVVLEDGVDIGNFVEVKRSYISAGAKAKHLAYLGDAEVGPKANIGAGTIVANYDGKSKHPTRIGAGAFIGSGSVLVAPVEIGPRSTVGAGAVVLARRDVPEDGVVVGVPARSILPSSMKAEETS